MIDSWIIILEISVSFVVGVTVLGMVVWGLRSGQFDDGKKMSEGLLFDNNEDLQAAAAAEAKAKDIKNKKLQRELQKLNKENNDISRI